MFLIIFLIQKKKVICKDKFENDLFSPTELYEIELLRKKLYIKNLYLKHPYLSRINLNNVELNDGTVITRKEAILPNPIKKYEMIKAATAKATPNP